MKRKILFSLLLIVLTGFNQDKDFNGKVIRIVDGDTIVVLNEKKLQIKIRLEGIDCPESNQDFGTRAKQMTSELCFEKQVRVMQSGTDWYGRVLAYVYVDNLCLNEELIRQGMAWHFKKYNKDQELAQLEATARTLKVGLWAKELPIAPWEWRSNN